MADVVFGVSQINEYISRKIIYRPVSLESFDNGRSDEL